MLDIVLKILLVILAILIPINIVLEIYLYYLNRSIKRLIIESAKYDKL